MAEEIERLVNRGALESYLRDELGAAERFEVEYAEGGIANETLFVTWGNRELVLRRPPAEETSDSGHQILRDYTVFKALEETKVPVPKPVAHCHDPSIIGKEFYLAERVQGIVPHPEEPEAMSDPEIRSAVSDSMIETLVDIHEVDYESRGLGEFGYPEGFTRRQIRQWSEQIEWATSVTAEERPLPDTGEIREWLETNYPETIPDPSLVHGDFGLHNLMFSTDDFCEIVAVFDWELGTIGNPLVDIGWLLMFWPDPDDDEILAPELIPAFVKEDGYPSRTELVERYESVAGRSFHDRRFYRVLGAYKLIGVGEMLFARHLNRNSTNSLFQRMETIVPTYVDRTRRIIEADDPLQA